MSDTKKESHTIDDIEDVEVGDGVRIIFRNGRKNWLLKIEGGFNPGAHSVYEEEER